MSKSPFVNRGVRALGARTDEVLTEEAFRRMLRIEQIRSRRTQSPFALVTIETRRSQTAGNDFALLPKVLAVVRSVSRKSDLTGWMETGASIGVMLMDLQSEKRLDSYRSRILNELRKCLTPDQVSGIRFRCSTFFGALSDSESATNEDALAVLARSPKETPAPERKEVGAATSRKAPAPQLSSRGVAKA
jgi:hypothetical protein